MFIYWTESVFWNDRFCNHDCERTAVCSIVKWGGFLSLLKRPPGAIKGLFLYSKGGWHERPAQYKKNG